MMEETINESVEIAAEKPYELKTLQAQHLFSLVRVISALKVKNIAQVFKDKIDVNVADINNDEVVKSIGYDTVIEIVSLLLDNLPNCQNELFAFLAAISNLNEKQVAELPLNVFFEMIMDVVKKDEFADFFTQGAKLLK